jgi:hypothetical protein
MNAAAEQAADAGASPKPIFAEALKRAKTAIAAGENYMRKAADEMAIAQSLGATQREIAAGTGKSVAWVNRLLQWRASGYQDETPFGAQAKASRQRASVQSTKRSDRREGPDFGLEAERLRAEANKAAAERAKAEAETTKAAAARAQADAAKAKANAARAQAEAAKAKADAERAKARAENAFKRKERAWEMGRAVHRLQEEQRAKLIKCLGMLGSDYPGERANAAAAVEKLRTDLRLMWDDLIISATDDP